MNIYEFDVLTNKIIFVDGITRTGKALLNTLLLGFEKTSSIQFFNVLEQLMPMYVNNKISRNAMSAFLKLYLNENFYNYKLSRNLNFRYNDLTSIYNTKNPIEFLRNFEKNEGDAIIEEFLNEDLYFQFQTHDLLTHFSSFLDLNIDVQVIELFRHPIDTVHSWYKRGWGKRFDNVDKRNWTTLFKYKSNTISHYVVGNEEEYLKLNEMGKCVFMHNLLVKKAIDEYKKLDHNQKEKLLILKYEDLLINTEIVLNKISHFLDLERSSHMDKVKETSRVPRQISIYDRERKWSEIKSQVKIDLQEDLRDLTSYYEDKFYDLEA